MQKPMHSDNERNLSEHVRLRNRPRDQCVEPEGEEYENYRRINHRSRLKLQKARVPAPPIWQTYE